MLQRLTNFKKQKSNYIYTDKQGTKLFNTNFRIEDCKTIKSKLAQKEPITDTYNPVNQFQFRDIQPPENKPLFQTRLKCKPLENPYGVSVHDPRPKEALEREQREKAKK